MAFMGAIGKIFKLSGLDDILIEAGVVAQGSIAGMLSGHNYNSSLRAHKITYEALARLQLQQFVNSLDEVKGETYRNVAKSVLQSSDRAICNSDILEIYDLFCAFVTTESTKSPMFAYWSSYIKSVELLLMFIRATCHSNWDTHFTTFEKMLPYFFSLNRQKYAR